VPALAPLELERVARKWNRARMAPKVLEECGELGARSLWISDRERLRIAQGPGSGAPPSGKYAEHLDRRLLDPREKLWLAQELSSSAARKLEYTGQRSGVPLPELERPWQEPAALSRQQTNTASALRAARSPEKPVIVGTEELILHEKAAEIATKLRKLRRKRYELREVLTKASMQPRLQKCGKVILGEVQQGGQVIGHRGPATVTLGTGQHGARFSGVMACGSVWSCPCCAPKIARERQGMVDQLLRRHLQRHAGGLPNNELEKGGAMVMTFTVSHRWENRLGELRQAISLVHRKLWGGRAGKSLRKHWGIIGHVRSLEATHGLNGWHPHLHCVVLTEGMLSATEAEKLRLELAQRWCELAEKAKLARPLEQQQHGELIHSPEDAARYITKFDASEELTGFNNKGAREGGRTPFQILADYAREGRKYDLALWRTWEKEIKGARFLTWSAGLKKRYIITEKTDQEIVDAENNPMLPLVVMNKELFQSIAHSPKVRADLADTAETEGAWAVVEKLLSLQEKGRLQTGSRILAIYHSAALDRIRYPTRTAPEGGLTLALRLPQCILYETRLLPSLTLQEVITQSAARKGAT
jgi:hypothetical protein